VIPILAATLALVLAAMALLWIASLPIKNASIVDVFWGAGFVLITWAARALSANSSPRAWLMCVLVTCWGGRLAAHLAIRNVGHGEDYRYRAMRAYHGARFPIVSLGTVFGLQGVLMWLVSWPVQAAVRPTAMSPIGWIDLIGVALWTTGLSCEAIADAQLARFKRTADAAGRVMDRGLWRYSRHPNYFGDFIVWWGFGVIALSTGAWWALAGPVVMSVLLLKVSGVSLLESTIADRRPAYREYAARTSAFFPWPPRPSKESSTREDRST
jgi:steroid 5-alpha reductase family enzyme